ncbi:hypothetical protein JEU11_09985 [Paraglaciecola chathamensis]|uniref:Lipoprotein n=1 Tax=Paraglaciecola chathamensis TaxID=368405 RepID=A0ABS0WEA8_9ALTE|nr:hypothetical protein [Paraglaciecola chathamensis]MBJ2136782.1 hypothetical protein [Paraglaciecola chathamensis]
MRYFKVLLFILVTSGCASTEKQEVNSSQASAENAMQHVYLSGVIAKFYCTNAKWPQSLNELSEYSTGNPTPIGSKIDWSVLNQNGVTFNVATDIYIRTPGNPETGIMSVSSTHKYPGCNGDSISINFQPVLGG